MTGRITWLGHSTVLVEAGDVRVLTDPVLRGRIAHLRRHAPVAPTPERLDAVLVSHLHRDHADGPSLRRLAGVPVVVPQGAGPVVRRLGPTEVVEVQVGARVAVGGGTVLAVPAEHDGRRSPLSAATASLGFVVEADGARVYFAGDTEKFAGMADLGPLDVALIPVWGWGTSIGPGHLDPVEAAEAVALLRPVLAIPIHWGTYLPLGYRSQHRLLQEPGPAFAAAVRELSPEVRVAVPAPGEAVEF